MSRWTSQPLSRLATPSGRVAGNLTQLPVYSVTKHRGFVPSLEYFKKQVFSRELGTYTIVEPAYATIHLDEGSIGICPELCLISPMYTVFRIVSDAVHCPYLLRYMRSPRALSEYPRLGKGSVERRRAISFDRLADIQIPLPPFPAQRRIAAILDKADELRAKRRAALAQLDTLTQSIFLDMFGDPATNPKGWPETACLGEVADIVSGVTKGRQFNGKVTRLVPYLAVINVQDRALNLATVKMIEATEEEIKRYRLQKGDLLLTEGGDPDKLGRGTLWGDELPECIHQNHVFRVRLTSGVVEPLFLEWLIGSTRGKRYFLRSAKQTTGIATINMTQLRGFPLLLPPVELQHEFARRLAAIEHIEEAQRTSLSKLNGAFASLQHRAFRGEL